LSIDASTSVAIDDDDEDDDDDDDDDDVVVVVVVDQLPLTSMHYLPSEYR
jgi:hypothetical protein